MSVFVAVIKRLMLFYQTDGADEDRKQDGAKKKTSFFTSFKERLSKG